VQQAELSATEQTGVAVSKQSIIVVRFYEAKIGKNRVRNPPY
jgi:hypothetical protein